MTSRTREKRDIPEATMLTKTEAAALRDFCDEYGLTKRIAIRAAILRMLRERGEVESLKDFRLSSKAL